MTTRSGTQRGSAVRIEPFPLLKRTERRASAYLVDYKGYAPLQAFEAEADLVRRQLRSRMDHWVDHPGEPWKDQYYHGWSKDEFGGKYVHCFVFTYQYSLTNVRLYGFLAQPRAPQDKRFQLFVAVHLCPKWQAKTEVGILKNLIAVEKDPAVIEAIGRYAREHGGA